MDFMTSIYIGFSIATIIVVISFVGSSQRQNSLEKKASIIIERALNKFPNYYDVTKISGDTLVLFIDDMRQYTLVATSEGQAKEIPFSEYCAIEILEDGYSVAETRKSGVLRRSAVGGLLGGGVGAVIGAVSSGSHTTQNEIVTNITVKISTNDKSFPELSWCTFAPKFAVDKMTKEEVHSQRKFANEFALQFAPIFEYSKHNDEDIVSI